MRELNGLDDILTWYMKNVKRYSVIGCFSTIYKSWNEKIRGLSLLDLLQKYFSEPPIFRDDIVILRTSITKEEFKEPIRVTCYLYLDSRNELLWLLSNNRSKYIKEIWFPIIHNEPGIYFLGFTPSSLLEYHKQVLEKYDDIKLIFFKAKSIAGLGGKIRPEYERTILYYGKDADRTLREFSYYYGVIPTVFRYYIPAKLDFFARATGIFTFMSGERELFIELVKLAVDVVLRHKRTLDEARTRTLPFRTATKQFTIIEPHPLIIKFSTSKDETFVENLVKHLIRNEFSIYNEVLLTGSFRFYANVVDDKEGGIFMLSIDPTHLVITAGPDVKTISLIRLLNVITQKLDANVEVVQVKRWGGNVSNGRI